MTDRELFEKTFSHLHASDRTLEEVYNVVQNEHSSHTKRYNARRAGRIILIAAALSLLLAVTAFAVYQHTVADLAMDDPQSVGVPYAVTWDGDTRQFYTVAGYDKQSPEYRAQAEWLYFTRFTEPGYDARQVLPAADPHHIYNAGHQVSGGTAPTYNGPMLTMDELKALAESYDFAAMETFDRQARQDAVARLCAEQLTASGRAGIDRGEEARIVYGELGDYAVTALPEGFVFSSSHVETFDSSGDTLWAAETGGGYVSVSVSYAGPEDRIIDLTYSRTWEDREKGIVNDRLGFDPEYILNDDSLELHPGAVNGHEAYYWTFSDAFSSVLFLHWLDTDEHIACRLAVPADLFTPADAIAIAESVQAR